MKPSFITIALVMSFAAAKAQETSTQHLTTDTTERLNTPRHIVFGKDTILAYVSVQQPPEPKGGLKALYMFIAQNIRYPKNSRAMGIQGKVIVSFIVEEDGSIGHIRVLRSVWDDIDAEAVRIISKLPKWNPGLQDGKPVKVVYSIPISFSIKAGLTTF